MQFNTSTFWWICPLWSSLYQMLNQPFLDSFYGVLKHYQQLHSDVTHTPIWTTIVYLYFHTHWVGTFLFLSTCSACGRHDHPPEQILLRQLQQKLIMMVSKKYDLLQPNLYHYMYLIKNCDHAVSGSFYCWKMNLPATVLVKILEHFNKRYILQIKLHL